MYAIICFRATFNKNKIYNLLLFKHEYFSLIPNKSRHLVDALLLDENKNLNTFIEDVKDITLSSLIFMYPWQRDLFCYVSNFVTSAVQILLTHNPLRRHQ